MLSGWQRWERIHSAVCRIVQDCELNAERLTDGAAKKGNLSCLFTTYRRLKTTLFLSSRRQSNFRCAAIRSAVVRRTAVSNAIGYAMHHSIGLVGIFWTLTAAFPRKVFGKPDRSAKVSDRIKA
jgi:hypothetical protein